MLSDGIATSAAFTLIGAILGSVLSPACEIFFARWLPERPSPYTASNGLALLCGANGAWVVSFIAWQVVGSTPAALFFVFGMYVVALLLFIGAFRISLNAKENILTKELRDLILILIVGNFLWLLGESVEVILASMDMDFFPPLCIKYFFFILSGTAFIYAIYSSLRKQEIVPVQQSR